MPGNQCLPAGDAGLSEKQRRILAYLREQVETRTYFKSRLIAEDIELSAQEVGRNLIEIVGTDVDLDIEPWAYTSGTTWKVTV